MNITTEDLRDLCRGAGLPGADIRDGGAGWMHICTPCGHITLTPDGEPYSARKGTLREQLDRLRADNEHEYERMTARLAAVRAALGRE